MNIEGTMQYWVLIERGYKISKKAMDEAKGLTVELPPDAVVLITLWILPIDKE